MESAPSPASVRRSPITARTPARASSLHRIENVVTDRGYLLGWVITDLDGAYVPVPFRGVVGVEAYAGRISATSDIHARQLVDVDFDRDAPDRAYERFATARDARLDFLEFFTSDWNTAH